MTARARRGSGSLEHRNGAWWIQRSQTNTVTGKRSKFREGPFATKAEAELRQAAPSSLTYEATMPADRWFVDWCERAERRHRVSERHATADNVIKFAKFMAPHLAGLRLIDVRKAWLNNLWTELCSEPRSRTNPRPYTAKYLNNIRNVLSQAMEDAVDEDVIAKNWAQKWLSCSLCGSCGGVSAGEVGAMSAQ